MQASKDGRCLLPQFADEGFLKISKTLGKMDEVLRLGERATGDMQKVQVIPLGGAGRPFRDIGRNRRGGPPKLAGDPIKFLPGKCPRCFINRNSEVIRKPPGIDLCIVSHGFYFCCFWPVSESVVSGQLSVVIHPQMMSAKVRSVRRKYQRPETSSSNAMPVESARLTGASAGSPRSRHQRKPSMAPTMGLSE